MTIPGLLSPASRRNLGLAFADLRDGVASIYIWPMLGWQEIKHRYRRSVLGPFWLTLSTGLLIAMMGPLYGKLLGQSSTDYVHYLASSYVVWLFLSSLWIESCNAFIGAEGFIRQIKLPLTIHVLRLVWRNLIIFAHHLVIVLVVLLWYRPGSATALLLAPLGIFIVALNGVWLGIVFGTVCARFRDVPPIITSVAQLAFFMTPVFWKADMLGKYRWAAEINPFYHLLEIVRAPLLGEFPSNLTWLAVTSITLFGYFVMLVIFSRFRARIAYWV